MILARCGGDEAATTVAFGAICGSSLMAAKKIIEYSNDSEKDNRKLGEASEHQREGRSVIGLNRNEDPRTDGYRGRDNIGIWRGKKKRFAGGCNEDPVIATEIRWWLGRDPMAVVTKILSQSTRAK
ncbi:unnamed protein product [Arabidopsis lyrata]|uniref:Predicted protein n=1 Tax=Arabidopsis lyrata subsp. lyrata TaxID=81972 RepID=D7M8V4_ARALL|nr:predicted protein [Arabidopsis lyrata subsp. lyrata]CAH8275514.1 unnamed protein product [Arabidopsis lyrata]